VLSTRVSTLGNDVAHRWDPAAGRDGDGIMLVSAMAERTPGQSLPAVAGAVPRAVPRCTPPALLSSLAQSSHNLQKIYIYKFFFNLRVFIKD